MGTLRTGAPRTNTLLDRVQRETLRYFTDFAHPACGMARERSGTANMMDTVTTGGTGFGIMAMIAGAERGFIDEVIMPHSSRRRIARAFASLRGRLRLPSRGELASKFGSPREGGGTTWKGLFPSTEPAASL